MKDYQSAEGDKEALSFKAGEMLIANILKAR